MPPDSCTAAMPRVEGVCILNVSCTEVGYQAAGVWLCVPN